MILSPMNTKNRTSQLEYINKVSPVIINTLEDARMWPVKQAKEILKRMKSQDPNKPIVLEMGYGPSGTPHLGTVTEVIRTMMVIEVLRKLTDKQVIFFAFSDDMDGMRKFSPKLPNQDMLKEYLGKPLSCIPDPYGRYENFAEHNHQKLIQLIRSLGYNMLDYRPTQDNPYSEEAVIDIIGGYSVLTGDDDLPVILLRSSDMYHSGSFDKALHKVLWKHSEILEVILPTLGEVRRATYSPFMPISTVTGQVLEVGVEEYHPENGEIVVKEGVERRIMNVNGKQCKLQWKVDFAMRWYRLGIDYEMAGKDIDVGTNPIARRVCEILGGTPPINWMYEMFLAEDNTRISKIKGNGISLDEMVRYMPASAIRHFMFLRPESAKRLDIKNIPRYIDDFLLDLNRFHHILSSTSDNIKSTYKSHDDQNEHNTDSFYESPIFYSRNSGTPNSNITAAMALNLIRGLNMPSAEQVIEHLRLSIPLINEIDKQVIECMYHFYEEHYEKPNFYPLPDALRPYALQLKEYLSLDATQIQEKLYQLGNTAIDSGAIQDLKSWFQAIYRAILGQDQGRRLGAFFAMCGKERAEALIDQACGRS